VRGIERADGKERGKSQVIMKLKQWLKTYGLGFFSDKIAKDAPKFGFTGVFLSLLMSFLFILFGYYGADVAPFATHYNNAGSYKEFIHAAFDGGVDLTVENGKGVSGRIINTYSQDGDAAYKKNGYNLIVDTRPSDTLIEFEQVAIRNNNGEYKISYEEYLALGEQNKKDYRLAVGYSGKLLEITPEKTEKYAAYLENISDAASDGYNQSAAEQYKKLKDSKADYGEDDYAKELYYLYVRYYYSGVRSVYASAEAPVLRDYYYANYITKGNAYYFYVFDDMCAGSFETDNGVPVVFGGYFRNRADGKVTDIDALISDSYYDTAGSIFGSYFVSAISQLPLLIFIPLILGLLTWGIGKAVKDCWEKSFSGCYKTVNVFVWVSALITALVIFIGGFITSARLLYSCIPAIFGGVLLIRTVIFCAVSAVKNRKRLVQSKRENNDDIFGGNL